MSDTKIILTRKQKAIIAEALNVMPEDLEEINIKASPRKKTSFCHCRSGKEGGCPYEQGAVPADAGDESD